MINTNPLKLTLFQPLPYTKMAIKDNKQDITKIYKSLLEKVDKEPTGCEGIMKFGFKYKDSIDISLLELGFADPPTEETRLAVLNGDTIPLPEHDMEIQPGKYQLIQLPALPQDNSLLSTFIPYICSSLKKTEGIFYFRLLKENSLVVLSQIILTSEE